MKKISSLLTPEQVATFRDWADLDPIVPNQELRAAIRALGRDWLALQVQLAEAEAESLALAKFIKTADIHNCEHCKRAQTRLLARPGVVKLLEGATP